MILKVFFNRSLSKSIVMMDNSVYYVIGLFTLILFLMMLSRQQNQKQGYYTQVQRRRPSHHRNQNGRHYDYGDQSEYGSYHAGRRVSGYYEKNDVSGTWIGLAFLVLIGFGIYWYNQNHIQNQEGGVGIQEIPTEHIEAKPEESSYDDRLDYSVDTYPNNNGIDSRNYDMYGGPPDYFQEESLEPEASADEQSTPISSVETPKCFYAQTGAFAVLENAQKSALSWVNQGLPTKIVLFSPGDNLFHVLVGAYDSVEAAKGFMGKKYDRIYKYDENNYYELAK